MTVLVRPNPKFATDSTEAFFLGEIRLATPRNLVSIRRRGPQNLPQMARCARPSLLGSCGRSKPIHPSGIPWKCFKSPSSGADVLSVQLLSHVCTTFSSVEVPADLWDYAAPALGDMLSFLCRGNAWQSAPPLLSGSPFGLGRSYSPPGHQSQLSLGQLCRVCRVCREPVTDQNHPELPTAANKGYGSFIPYVLIHKPQECRGSVDSMTHGRT